MDVMGYVLCCVNVLCVYMCGAGCVRVCACVILYPYMPHPHPCLCVRLATGRIGFDSFSKFLCLVVDRSEANAADAGEDRTGMLSV